MKELTERGLRLPHAKALTEKLQSLRGESQEPEPAVGKLGKSLGVVSVGKSNESNAKLGVTKVNITTISKDSLKEALEELFQKRQR